MRRNSREINEDRILVNLYQLALNHDDIYHAHQVAMLTPIEIVELKTEKNMVKSLHSLAAKGYVRGDYFDTWAITDAGIEQAKRIVVENGGESL